MAVFLTGSSMISLFPKPSSTTPGDIIEWDDKEWLVCHYDSSNNRVYLIAKDIVSKTIFGSNATYAGSTLASAAADYQSNNMSAAALKMCVNVTVNGVTSKVFVPSYEQMSGGFSWFNNNTNRIANYQGSANWYCTSSPYNSGGVWSVGNNGGLDNVSPSTSNGFRPCVCVQM